ncbi:type I DNA topoisomerase [Limibaculum sp. M0105]|uniref:DNA topoisomerase 1 n=1 Tax=Thermohalobaculum xanthum TaxID=2753746 RepID=A0A8J7M9K5_9RHOB|nr:type I DNA topoisomerase [Thermohalobaculum xanthum]MBK0401246.1 type I DNA topoisomerase [Thermohalobaculum xanthum]
MAVVVVESPAKAKTINAYLGRDFTVLASYGHVRDLPAKDGSVDTDHGFEMTWEVDPKSQKHIRAIAEALKEDGRLILATDPDREGEAISWHLLETLRARRAVKKDTPVERVVFNAITRSAVTEAMQKPRDIDMELVEAYLARRALDYLVGFNLSPVLWRKLPGARSAGRVQSVALRLIVEREMEIEAFRPREYWSVRALLATPSGETFEARLVSLDGRRLDRFDLGDADAAAAAVKAVLGAELSVASVEAKPATRNPAPPFMTSTLQQEASRKLGFGAQQTMRTAQTLYEAGHITYMRTDGVDMAPEAVSAARATIASRYGDRYLPAKPRIYKSKAKNAQEAHECIRPTVMDRAPGDIRLDRDQARLYELIWQRAVASQMEAARFERTTVEIADARGRAGLRATGQVVIFDGFLAVYEEGRDEPSGDEDDRRLPQIAQGDRLSRAGATLVAAFDKAAPDGTEPAAIRVEGGLRRHPAGVIDAEGAVLALQSFTQPPPRYTEATLVKRMEELGIGRPSTYASIISTIEDRDYVRKEKGRLVAEDKGRLVTAFLVNYFPRYVEYDFTAGLEEELDDISGGRIDWKDVLARFWRDFSAAVSDTSELRITDVLEKINEALGPHLFPDRGDGSDPRLCPVCGAGRLSIKTSSKNNSAFIGCSNYPECRYTRPFGAPSENGEANGERVLGTDPETGLEVSLRSGRFGPYVQLGEATEDTPKPKRSSLPKGVSPADLTLEMALNLLALPRVLGPHPDDGEPVEAGIGRFGPYVKHGRIYANIPAGEDVLTIGMNRAVTLIAEKASRGPGGRGAAAKKPLRELGDHPDGGPVAVMSGRYGPYVKWEKVNATLPKTADPAAITMEEALALIAARASKGKGGRTAKGSAKKAPAKKAPAKKTAAKKPATKKSAGAAGSPAGKG